MAIGESSFKLILGTHTKARQRILTEKGYEFIIMTADIDEKSIRKEKPEELVTALAEAKAAAITSRLQNSGIMLEKDAHTTLLITADTVVGYKGMIREKACSEEEAREFIKGYSGGNAAVVGSVLMTNIRTGASKGGWKSAEIDEGIPFKVAGGLMLENPLTLPFVEAVIGAADTVMGLSKSLTEKLIIGSSIPTRFTTWRSKCELMINFVNKRLFEPMRNLWACMSIQRDCIQLCPF